MSVTCYSVGFFGQLWGTQGYPGVLKGTQGSSGVLQLTPGYFGNCQAKVQTKPRQTPNSKFQTPDSQSRLEWHYNWKDHPPHPPKTFEALLECLLQSVIPFWKPLMASDLNPSSDERFLQLFATQFDKPKVWKLQKVLPPKEKERTTERKKKESKRE